MIHLTRSGALLVDGAELDAGAWTRRPVEIVEVGESLTALEAVRRLGEARTLRHLVIGVIGPREATDSQAEAAFQIGKALGALGLTLICGGRSGVMEAVSKGCDAADGLLIGILPGNTPDEANPYVGIPLPTGLAQGRNMVIARSARVLIAVGGSYGTLSEVAFGLHFSKPVIGLEAAPKVDGVTHVSDADAAVEAALSALLRSAPPAP